jgi:hypothetical protein
MDSMFKSHLKQFAKQFLWCKSQACAKKRKHLSIIVHIAVRFFIILPDAVKVSILFVWRWCK